MIFGRFYGVFLAVLGLLLLAVQAYIYESPDKRRAGDTRDASLPAVERRQNYFPGIFGFAALAGGTFISLTQRKRNTEIGAKNAAR
jgi:hypothetical protein